jgi:hypothetical protein
MTAKLNTQTAQAVLEYALSEGLLTEDQIALAISKSPTAEMMRIASLLHQASCQGDHDGEGNAADFCPYYNEEFKELPPHQLWQEPAHARAMKRAVDFMRLLELENEDEFVRVFKQATKLNSELNKQREEQPQAYMLLLLLRGWKD